MCRIESGRVFRLAARTSIVGDDVHEPKKRLTQRITKEDMKVVDTELIRIAEQMVSRESLEIGRSRKIYRTATAGYWTAVPPLSTTIS